MRFRPELARQSRRNYPLLPHAVALLLSLSAAPVRPATVSHVVQVSLDGLGATYLQFYVTNAPEQFPAFARLTAEAAFTFNARCDYDFSETVPNHASMLTGRPVWRPAGEAETVHHGYDRNFPGPSDTFHNAGNPAVPYKASVFDVVHDYGLSTAFYAGKTRLAICERSYDALNGALDLIETDEGRDKIDFVAVADVGGAAVSNQVNLLLENLAGPAPQRYHFIHLAEPDRTGHSSGWGSLAWSNMVRQLDAQLGRLLEVIDSSPLLSNQMALIITTDHGGGGVTFYNHTEPYHLTNYTIPFFLRAPGISGGADLYSLFSNRADPGTNRTDYTVRPQPIRNGDAGNLALALLGLPPIPGSYMSPALATPRVALLIARHEDRLDIFWTDPADAYQLQTALTPAGEGSWQSVTNGISLHEATKVYTITNAVDTTPRFFRLRER